MSDEKVPRFLQQTTSQLLHQQEALRKRREMLERESKKPPAMRFGTRSPPRSHGRHAKSPPPPSASSLSDHHGTPTPLAGTDAVRRELNWSRSEDDVGSERAPMQFSMNFRPAPGPLSGNSSHKPRGDANAHVPSVPSPREVNTADRVHSAARKAAREASSPSTPSPRSPASQRTRVDGASRSAERRQAEPTAPVEAPQPHATRSEEKATQVPSVRPSEAHTAGVAPVTESPVTAAPVAAEKELSRWERRQSLPPPPPFTRPTSTPTRGPEQRPTDDDGTGIAAFSNSFPMPRFTATTPLAAKGGAAARREGEAEADEEEESTPGRPAVGEFRTPLPVTRMSLSLTPTVADPAVAPAQTLAEPTAVELGLTDGDSKRSTASPAPRPSQIMASLEASAEKRGGSNGKAPAMSREVAEDGKSPSSRVLQVSPSASQELRTPSPTRRTKASPVPTAQDLIQSVQASADRRPCGCERPTPSPETWQRHRTTTSSRPTAPSPTPTPVSPFDAPMTAFAAATVKCCDRPTPVSLSSQPAGGEPRSTAATSSSPWPTTENIISSILAGTQETQRRARDGATASEEHAEGECPTHEQQRFSTGIDRNEEAADAPLLDSPTATDPSRAMERAAWTEDEEEPTPGETAGVMAAAATHTPSPIPTERQYGESVLASAEKRRCGRPTPGDRQSSAAGPGESTAAPDALGTSASPQPSTHHLLDSLNVSAKKVVTREGPAERLADKSATGTPTTTPAAGEATASLPHNMRTPSPTPTPDHVMASLHASAEKRTRSVAVEPTAESVKLSLVPSSTDHSPDANAFQSPMLTPQNVTDSIQKLVADKQQTRSDAQTPLRPWGESGQRFSATTLRDSASPVLTAEDVDLSLGTLEQDQRRKSRSLRAPTESDPSPSAVDMEQQKAEEEEEEEEGHDAEAPGGVAVASADVVPSPAASEFVTQSDMFFECVSAPITPSAPTMDGAAGIAGTATAATHSAGTSNLPAQLLALEREIRAMSKSRSRTLTPPPPLQASESLSPVPRSRSSVQLESQTRAEASLELPHDTAVTEAETLEGERRTVETEEDEKQQQEQLIDTARRSSLVLVHPTESHVALLQRPHEPMPMMPPPRVSPVQVPRTPTPPPRRLAAHRHPLSQPRRAEAEESANEESPLPRPVPLSSQVSAPRVQEQRHAQTPPPAWVPVVAREQATLPLDEDSPTPVLQSTHQTHAADVSDEEAEKDLFDSKNDWMDLAQPLRERTITVSPAVSAAVLTTYSSPRSDSRDAQSVPRETRKRSRESATQNLEDTPKSAVPSSAATPTAAADVLSEQLMGSPDSHVAQTPHSATRGRRSQAEELLAMLPAEVVAEVQRIERGESISTDGAASEGRLSGGAMPLSRLSGLSEADSVVSQTSSISQRVSQRTKRTPVTYDSYICSLESHHVSSASKTGAAKEARKKKKKGKKAAKKPPTADAPPSTVTSPARRNRGPVSSAADSPSSPSPTPVSPAGPPPQQQKLKVSTQLSAKVQQALFQQPATEASSAKPTDTTASKKKKKKSKKARNAMKAKKAAASSLKVAPAEATVTKTPSPKKSSAPLVESSAAGKEADRVTHGKRGSKKARKLLSAKASKILKQKAK